MKLFEAVINWGVTHSSFIAAIYALVTFFLALFLTPFQRFADFATALASVEFPAVTSVTVSAFTFVNYFVPLDLALELAAAYMLLWLVVQVVRIVKSFVPFIS